MRKGALRRSEASFPVDTLKLVRMQMLPGKRKKSIYCFIVNLAFSVNKSCQMIYLYKNRVQNMTHGRPLKRKTLR